MESRGARSGLFLMELIMSVLIFTVAATICIQMFVKSHLLSEESTRLNHAVIWCESMAETFYAADGNLTKLQTILGGDIDTINSSIVLHYNEEYEPSGEVARYEVKGRLLSDESQGLVTLNIECVDIVDNKLVYELNPVLCPREIK